MLACEESHDLGGGFVGGGYDDAQFAGRLAVAVGAAGQLLDTSAASYLAQRVPREPLPQPRRSPPRGLAARARSLARPGDPPEARPGLSAEVDDPHPPFERGAHDAERASASS